jgi:two-component system NtrC family sensor kinase
MSLRKKITFSFLISVFIITLLAIFEYVNFLEIRKEIKYLETIDTIRHKSLQLRRHEKNFFLYSLTAKEEGEAVHKCLLEINNIIDNKFLPDKTEELSRLKLCIKEYERRFSVIESSAKDLWREFEKTKISHAEFHEFFPIIESTLIENPNQRTEFLQKVFLLPPDSKLIAGLRKRDSRIRGLREEGENIISITNELDTSARKNVDNTIRISRLAIFIFLPLFFITGIGTIFFFNRDVVNRLKILTGVVEKTGKGKFSHVQDTRDENDEVGILIQKFNDMEEQLILREEELDRKNKELLQSKKLAAIGTLASGVAHELNNPLNNIYISSQVLEREINREINYASSPNIRGIVTDIRHQTLRVKRIVGDLLEFAKGKDPDFKEVELNHLITGAYRLLSTSMNMDKIRFALESDPNGVIVSADPGQLERVFINLFTNAADAVSDWGDLTVKIVQQDDSVNIKVSDTGRGMPAEAAESMFEPFFTTKDTGTGLGLAIVFNIIKKHNGEINTQSEEGKGTTITITLPRGRKSHGS